MSVTIKHKEKILFSDVRIADNPATRLVGLMFSRAPRGEGLLLEPCNSIHTFFMLYDLDVVFLSRSNEVVRIIRNLRPWRMTWIYFRARKTLEVPGGRLPPELKVGDVLEVQSV